MAEFERPRAKALSDAELARALQMFPSDATGVEAAGRLMAQQQKLREQDAQELQAWIELLRERDDAQSRKILAESLATIFPGEPLQVEKIAEEPALFTSELPVITRRGRVARRLQFGRTLRVLVLALLLAVSNSAVLSWLGISGFGAVVAVVSGLAISFAIVFALKRHLLHPILRSAAVFGGRGVYGFSALALAAASLAYSSGFLGISEVGAIAKVGPFSAILILCFAGASLVGQIISVRFASLVILVPALIALVLMSIGSFSFELSSALSTGWHWGAAGVALISTLILIFGVPHQQLEITSYLWLLPISSAVAIAVSSVSSIFSDLAAVFVLTALAVALVYAGRDLAGGSLGRLAGLAPLIGLVLTPFADQLLGVAVSVLAAATVLMIADQFSRTSPLHVPSLDTSYGFYGSVAIVSWLALIVAGFAGTEFVTAGLPQVFNHLEWSLVLGAGVGVLVGLIRTPIVRRQDREIKNIDSSSGNIENLLGL